MDSRAVRPKRRAGVLSTLQRGLGLLEAVADGHGDTTAKRLAERIGVRLGTCYHLLRTLQEEGYVVRLPGGNYGLGGRSAFLYDLLRVRLTPDPQLLTILQSLYEEVNETVYIAGWSGEDIVLEQYVEANQTLRVGNLAVGYRVNTHARASGKAILAFLREERVAAYFATRGLPRLTRNTITDLESLLDHLEATARRGFAVDREEFAEGVCCIGAAFFDSRSFPVGSYTVSVPRARLDRRFDELPRAVVRAATEASERLGYSGPYPPTSPLEGRAK